LLSGHGATSIVEPMARRMKGIDVSRYISTTPMAASALLCLKVWPSSPALVPSGRSRPFLVAR
jgi:hypothetical protein